MLFPPCRTVLIHQAFCPDDYLQPYGSHSSFILFEVQGVTTAGSIHYALLDKPSFGFLVLIQIKERSELTLHETSDGLRTDVPRTSECSGTRWRNQAIDDVG